MKIELTEDQINSYPAGHELDIMIRKLIFERDDFIQPGSINYSTQDSLAKDVCNKVIEKLGMYQLTYVEKYNIGAAETGHRGDPPKYKKVFYAFDGMANPWGWGETQALAACRFALKAMLYRQMNIESGVWNK